MNHAKSATAEEWIDEADAPPEPEITNDPIYVDLPEYNFNEPVPESKAVDISYFNDTVFIGDSRTKGLLMYTRLSPLDYSSAGLNLLSLRTKEYIRLPDENGELQSHTLLEALEIQKDSYKAIYIATGLNELGWKCSSFISSFTTLIDDIRAISDVPIYIQLIFPTTTAASESSEFGITNEKCFEFNAALRIFAAEKKLFLLDPIELFTLEDGTLNPAYSSDGVHFGVNACVTVANYYKTHIVDLYAYSNTTPKPPEASKLGFLADLSAYEEYMNPGNTKEFLTLVSPAHKLSSDYVPQDLYVVAATRADGRAKQTLRHNAAMALEALFAEMRAAGYTDVSVTSAYRSYSYQEQLFNQYLAMYNNDYAYVSTFSNPPGSSEHQTGLCLDMHNLPSADKSFGKTEAFAWLKENCWKFGFILRYPEDKTEITGISYEPWHYRYVGRQHAWEIHRRGMCLEEYLEFLDAK